MTRAEKIITGIAIGTSAFLIWHLFIDKEDYATARAEYIGKLPDDKAKLIRKLIADSGYVYSDQNSLAIQAQYPTMDAMKGRLADLNIPKYLRYYW